MFATAAGMAGRLIPRLRLLALGCCLLACADGADRAPIPQNTADAAGESDALAGTNGSSTTEVLCSDGEIAAAMRAVSEAEVSVAEALRENFVDPNAVALADKMLTEHSLLLEELKGATRAAQIAPIDCGLQRAIAAAAGAETASLQTLSSPALERAYVEREVLSHVQSFGLLDHVLEPGARNERIVFAVRLMRDVEATHQATVLAAERALEGACTSSGDE
jgi:putative membrane protein